MSKLIFTPWISFAPSQMAMVTVLPALGSEPPRLGIDLFCGSRPVFYGNEAVSVLRQLATAGVLSQEQADAMQARLADETALFAATLGSE